MNIYLFLALCILIVEFSYLSTYLSLKHNKIKFISYIPTTISLIGFLILGIGPHIFDYLPGITLSFYCIIIGIFFGIAFVSSLLLIISSRIKQ